MTYTHNTINHVPSKHFGQHWPFGTYVIPPGKQSTIGQNPEQSLLAGIKHNIDHITHRSITKLH